MPASERAFFEPRFGYAFDQVRIHTGSQAVEAARALNAQAFTVGQNVVIHAGQYAPESAAGQKLLAHELTHVVQQDPRKYRNHMYFDQLVAADNMVANKDNIQNTNVLQRLPIPEEGPPSGLAEDETEKPIEERLPGTGEGEIEEPVEERPSGTAEAPEAEQASQIPAKSNPQLQVISDPVRPHISVIQEMLRSVFEASFENRKPSETERGRKLVYDKQGNVSSETGVLLGNEPRWIGDDRKVLSVNLTGHRFQTAEGQALFGTEITVHTHVRYEGRPLPSDRPEENAGDLANIAETPEQSKIHVIAREQRQHVPGGRFAKRRVHLTIIYRGPIFSIVEKPVREELDTRREVGRVLQKRLPGTDVRVYKAVYQEGKIIKMKQVYSSLPP